MKKVSCATYEGLEAKVVEVESTLTKGLPSFSIVGIASTAITEAKERVKSALLCNEFTFPPKRITINLAPSDLKKEGSHFDLSFALLIALDYIKEDLSDWFVFGELGLDGSVKENNTLYPLILSLANQGLIKKAIVPKESLEKLSKIPRLELYGVSYLKEAIDLLQNKDAYKPTINTQELGHSFYELHSKKYYYQKEYKKDFIEIKGQEFAKRAALIAASGFNNILIE